MSVSKKKIAILAVIFTSVFVLGGCTDWQKEYRELEVEYDNLKGRHELLQQDRGLLEERLTESQQTIEELQRQMQERKQSGGVVTGFGEDFDVTLDARAGTITVTLPNTILFSPGKATLKSATSAELNHIESVLRSKYSGRQIDVVGHTDSDPIKKSPWKDNWELSAQRALSVVRYLVQRGIDDANIRAIGCGEAQPIADNKTAAGKAKNRRVEIVVHMR
ncbi:MAG: OmpA/MotB family protein [Planctomycetota bacterium]|jgi:chemotaxis protein MotB